MDKRLASVYFIRYTGAKLGASTEDPRSPLYQTAAGAEPVRDWLKDMDQADRRAIGADIATVEHGWPIGMPTCRSLGAGLWEVRTSLEGGRIARVLFAIVDGRMVLLHGFMKTTQKTPKADLSLAGKRKKEIER